MSQAGSRGVEAVTLATIVLFGLLSVVSFRALLPLALISTIALVALRRDAALFREIARSPVSWALGGILLAGAVSWTVSIDPPLTAAKIFQLTAIFGVGLVMIAAFRRAAAHVDPQRLRIACLTSIGLMIAGILIVTFLDEPLIGLGVPGNYFHEGPDHLRNRASALLAVWVCVIVLFGGRRFWPTAAAALGALYGGYAFASAPFGPVVAMACGLGAGMLALLIRRGAIIAIGAATVLVLATILPVFHFHGDRILDVTESRGQGRSDSAVSDALVAGAAVHRLEIWHSVADRAVERVWSGWGLDATRRVPANRETYNNEVRTTINLHPHNSFLQIWLEMGLVGAIAAMVAIVAIARRAHALARDRRAAIALSAAAGTALLIFSVSYGVFQSWWIAGLFLIAAFVALILEKQPAAGGPQES